MSIQEEYDNTQRYLDLEDEILINPQDFLSSFAMLEIED